MQKDTAGALSGPSRALLVKLRKRRRESMVTVGGWKRIHEVTIAPPKLLEMRRRQRLRLPDWDMRGGLDAASPSPSLAAESFARSQD